MSDILNLVCDNNDVDGGVLNSLEITQKQLVPGCFLSFSKLKCFPSLSFPWILQQGHPTENGHAASLTTEAFSAFITIKSPKVEVESFAPCKEIKKKIS